MYLVEGMSFDKFPLHVPNFILQKLKRYWCLLIKLQTLKSPLCPRVMHLQFTEILLHSQSFLAEASPLLKAAAYAVHR